MALKRISLLAALALMVPATAGATTARPDLQRRLDSVEAVGALAEVRDPHGVWRGTSGVAERNTTRAVPKDGRFRTGSGR